MKLNKITSKIISKQGNTKSMGIVKKVMSKQVKQYKYKGGM